MRLVCQVAPLPLTWSPKQKFSLTPLLYHQLLDGGRAACSVPTPMAIPVEMEEGKICHVVVIGRRSQLMSLVILVFVNIVNYMDRLTVSAVLTVSKNFDGRFSETINA